ncbi:MAG: RNA methyltransferase [Lachnospiraceae bacterium]|nr:RNA methyltransferase [Lachnospiraceae bacterium]
MTPELKAVKNWQKKASARETDRIFVTEGIRMFRELPRERIRKTVVSRTFLSAHPEIVPDLVVTDDLFASISETETPQGILAVADAFTYTLEDILSVPDALVLILENVQDPGNCGTMVRQAEAAGASGVVFAGACADIYNPKTLRATMGSVFRVPHVRTDSALPVLREIRKRGGRSCAAYLTGSVAYDTLPYTGMTAFLIGNEARGLTEETAENADFRIRIPMMGQVESLNAAAAATVLLFEAARQRRKIVTEI